MSKPQAYWQILPSLEIPEWFQEAVKAYLPQSPGYYAAQLLWQRGIRDYQTLAGFLDPRRYQPTSPFEFGQEMKGALRRLQQARERGEKVTIWGDFDADGITSTSVLWEGLGQFFTPGEQLHYYIPNRLTESHGLNEAGIRRLAAEGTKLIVTCDTGSTNLVEIDLTRELGIDIIVTDHHTLPPERPPVVAIINPRYFATNHPLYNLSGVAVAYKLVEAMYLRWPEIPQQPLEQLLDLVAIGLIADLVELSGDCRYLAQMGIRQLQKQGGKNATRPGIFHLLRLCQTAGDRPTDISFGLGPRINAVSRIHGDATFCVELLTSRDPERCQQLALETELANTRRKELQRNVTEDAKKKLGQLDLSTMSAIVLADPQWPVGVLGLVAGQIAQEYGRPTILLTQEEETGLGKGSARSVGQIDLYELVSSQADLLYRFGGHPFAAGLSLPLENLSLFQESINQQLKQQIVNISNLTPVITVDLTVTVADLGKELFQELKVLEPCGMGNPAPKLLLRDCYFQGVRNRNQRDYKGRPVKYIKSNFSITDNFSDQSFPGIWWGHYSEEIPQGQACDLVVELDFNTHQGQYEVRIIDLRLTQEETPVVGDNFSGNWLLDWRSSQEPKEQISTPLIKIEDCPQNWSEIQQPCREAIASLKKVALAYQLPEVSQAETTWQQLVGIAKYLQRTQNSATFKQLEEKLQVGFYTLKLGLNTLEKVGFAVEITGDRLQISAASPAAEEIEAAIAPFLAAVKEEQFRRCYFYQVPVETLEQMLS